MTDTSTPLDSRIVLVPILNEEHADEIAHLGVDIAHGADCDLLLVMFAEDSDESAGIPESYMRTTRESAQQAWRAREYADKYGDESPDIDHVVRKGDSPESILDTLIDIYPVETLVMEGPSDRTRADVFLHDTIDHIVATASCDVVVASHLDQQATLSRVFVPVARGPHSELAIDIAYDIASGNDAEIELFHVRKTDESPEDAEELLTTARNRLDKDEDCETHLHRQKDGQTVADAIVERAADYDMVVMGAPQESRLRQFVFGSTTEAVESMATSPVLTVRDSEESTGD